MQYQLPQFIEVEDKIFGPLTLKQFIYLAGGVGLSAIFYLILPTIYLSIIPMMLVMAFSLTLAFYKVNNKPFISVVESATKYYLNPKLYVWKKQTNFDLMKSVPADAAGAAPADKAPIFIPKMADSKLKDLVWSLDIREATNPIVQTAKAAEHASSAMLNKVRASTSAKSGF